MKLNSIEIQGFKSFVDRTRLEFDQGITAILGPNGCGKSNVVDAIRWVLGEQSAKTLRGGKMDDVIFKGTTKRRPVGMAEVTLTFSNDDHFLPIDFDEVAIKRKVTRDGGSDYFLNGSPCRLKDLRDLFYDSGVNNTSYSIIEESMIKQILNENNTELRTLLEEGSGITKYKARRKETQRKLDRTQNDLIRLYDIIEEIGREVRSLQRQVGKARRHQNLFKEIRTLDLLLAGRQHTEMANQEKAANERLEEFRTQAEVGVGELAELQAKIEAGRPQMDEREAERRQLEEALVAFEEELQEIERQVLVLQHRIEEHQRRNENNRGTIQETEDRQKEIEGQIQRMEGHLLTIEEELASSGIMLEERLESLQILEARLGSDRSSLDDATRHNLEFIENDASQRSKMREVQVKQENRRERMTILAEDRGLILEKGEAAGRELTGLQERRRERTEHRNALLQELAGIEKTETELEVESVGLQENVSALRAKLEAARSTCDLLQKLHNDYEGYGQGAREILKRHGSQERIQGGLADLLHVPQEDTLALETLLLDTLDAVVVDGIDSALDLVGELRHQEIGQARFLCGSGFDVDEVSVVEIPTRGRLARDVVSGPGLEIPALRNLLSRSVIFAEDDEAVAAAKAYTGPGILICLSLSGLLVSSDGSISGGRARQEAASTDLLGRKEKLDKLGTEISRTEDKLTAGQEQLATLRSRREELRESLIGGRSRLNGMDKELADLMVESAQLEDRRDSAGVRAREMETERVRLHEELEGLSGEEEQMTDLLSESGRQRQDSTTRREDLRQRVIEAEMTRDEARAQAEEFRLTHQRRESQKRETETALTHLKENVAELFTRRERLSQEIEVGQESMAALSEELVAKRELLGKSMEEREVRRQVVRAAAEGIQLLHDETDQWHQRVQAIEKQRGGFREQAHEAETTLATLEIRVNNLEERIEEQHKGSFLDLIATVDKEDLPKELEMDGDVFQISQASELLEKKRSIISSLGPINHLSLEEYESKKERLDFLEGQRDDVEKARDDLVKAITEINQTARKRFLQTFEDVRRNYIAVFKTLFKGGRADLRLINTDDPLESNLHVTAQPTGKVIDTVSLLSGGERCLTALSLLFAVYLVKPSPFCVLDEADAPLDDSNIERFVGMLREFSRSTQFLVITHNKLTMETANHLYGVTMMEPGCSSIVSVTFRDVAASQSDRELTNAIANKRSEVDQKEIQLGETKIEAEVVPEVIPEAEVDAETVDDDRMEATE
ncbi:MAG: chromosome segregation protein SMC [Gemmatimonadales bacterium]|nr:chromosome segregation protein SMC [Gemmatimonadales bacterium]